MTLQGRCYCGALHYEADGEPAARLECHCRECQYLSGGGPNFIVSMPADGFRYLQGTPRQFTRDDLPAPVTREFCGTCGTHLLTRSPRMPGRVLVKVGTLADPAVFGRADAVIFAVDAQPFHVLPAGVPVFERRKTA